MKWKFNVEYKHGKVLVKTFDTPTEMHQYKDKITGFCRDKYFVKGGEAQIKRTWFERG